MKRFLTLALSAAMLLSCFLVGCNKPDQPADTTATQGDTTEAATRGETTDFLEESATEPETSEETSSDTDETSSDTDEETEGEKIPLPEVETGITRAITSVTILSGDTPSEAYAAAEMKKYLEKKGVTVKDDAYTVSIRLDPAMDDDDYLLVVQRKNKEGTTITGGKRGVIYGVYRFLEDQAGIRFFTPELEIIPEGGMSITTGAWVHDAVLSLRQNDWYSVRFTPDWMVKNGINICDWYGPFSEEMGGSVVYGGFVHTLGDLTGTPNDSQPCLTDPANLEKTIANVRKILSERPNVNIVSVSQNDNWNYCKCESCAAIDAEEGSNMGSLLRFVNAVADAIAEDYPDVLIDTLAYQWSRTPTKITKPRPNVCIRLCSIVCDFTHALTDEDCGMNVSFCNDLVGWSEICDKIYIWDYTNNFRYNIPTYANLHVLRENMRFYAEHNVKGIFPQGNCGAPSGEFGELRAYLLAKLLVNPMMSEKEYYAHMDEFLAAYYGEGWEYIRSYINMTSIKADTGCQSVYGHPFEAIPEDYYRMMENAFEEWWSKAEELAGDRVEFVKRSRLQWRYIKLMLHPDEEEARKLIADVKAAGISWTETGSTDIPSDADLSKGPDEWFTFDWWL